MHKLVLGNDLDKVAREKSGNVMETRKEECKFNKIRSKKKKVGLQLTIIFIIS